MVLLLPLLSRMRLPPPVLVCLGLVLGPPGLADLAAQARPDRARPPAPWSLREEFDPEVIPGFAAWFQRSVDRVMEDAVARGVTPGAYVVVGHGGEVVLSRGYGRVDRAPGSPEVSDETIWDLASVTKAAATTLAAMILVDEGRLDLDAPLHRYLDPWPHDGAHARITVRHLLSHTSGLPAGIPARKGGSTGADWIRTLSGTPLDGRPGEDTTYSDLGPVLLALAVEAVVGEPFDRYVDRAVYRPLGLHRTTFRPLSQGLPVHDVAPTEVLPEGHLRGVVHDPTARALGGVAGNAGLFSSARDLAVLASALLWERPRRIVCRDVLRRFIHPQGDRGRFGLGWERPAGGGDRREAFSPSAFGHAGYTGTSIWIDPEQDLFVVLLTSRLNPTSANHGHTELRRDLHDVVGRAHTDDEAAARESDWRVAADWRGVDGCRADVGMELVARLGAGGLAALGW